jgi:hypothetical protein
MSDNEEKKKELIAQAVAAKFRAHISSRKEDWIDMLKYEIELLKIEEDREERDKIKREIRGLIKDPLKSDYLLPIDFEERPEEEQILYIEAAYKQLTTGEITIIDEDQHNAFLNWFISAVLEDDFKKALQWGVKLIDSYRTNMGKEYYADFMRKFIIRKFNIIFLPPEEKWEKATVEEKVRMIKEAVDKILRDRPFYF